MFVKKIILLIIPVIVCGIIFVLSFGFAELSESVSNINGMNSPTIIIDAGHGGFDGGASTDDGVPEKDINLNIALFLEDYLRVLDLIPTDEMERLFTKASKAGIGIELNKADMSFKDNEADRVLRMFKVAKGCGCKFYLGTDGHHPKQFENSIEIFDRAITLLNLQESDKIDFSRIIQMQ
jgi:hypothetical protein